MMDAFDDITNVTGCTYICMLIFCHARQSVPLLLLLLFLLLLLLLLAYNISVLNRYGD